MAKLERPALERHATAEGVGRGKNQGAETIFVKQGGSGGAIRYTAGKLGGARRIVLVGVEGLYAVTGHCDIRGKLEPRGALVVINPRNI